MVFPSETQLNTIQQLSGREEKKLPAKIFLQIFIEDQSTGKRSKWF